jgi:D-alanine-D-alanine ligase
VRRPKRLTFPLIVKSLTQEASIGISRASVVEDDAKLVERVRFIHESIGTDAIVERFIEGREMYVGVIGNQRLEVFPVWELRWEKLPDDGRLIMTDRAKWSTNYQKKYGVMTGAAELTPEEAARLQHLVKRAYRTLDLSGYARLDLRIDGAGRVYVLEANPNPQLAYGEDFAESAEHGGVTYEQLLQKIINHGLNWRPDRLG